MLEALLPVQSAEASVLKKLSHNCPSSSYSADLSGDRKADNLLASFSIHRRQKSLISIRPTNSTKLSHLSFYVFLCFAVISSACGPRRSVNEKRYELKGKVVAVNKGESTVTVSHEDIQGYMPAMTMAFKI